MYVWIKWGLLGVYYAKYKFFVLIRRGAMHLEINESYNPLYAESMQLVYQSVGWNKHTVEIIHQLFTVSTHVAIAFKEGKIIGFGRALSDGVFNGAIYDLVVHKEEQGKGVAQQILDTLLMQLKSVSCIHLISTVGNEEFYKKCGSRTVKTGMARYLSNELTETYLIE